ncbi:MAG TPA: hypothetical protein ENH91_16300 [Leeuwenhoekiella sp.]|nr:hypothetical protein [Leeuwenhoekiella sp.]
MRQFYTFFRIGFKRVFQVTVLFLLLPTGTFSMESGKIIPPVAEQQADTFSAHVNFQNNPAQTLPPEGYSADYGRAFGSSSITIGELNYAYGWKLAADETPFDASSDASNNSTGVGRNRLANYNQVSIQEKLLGTLVHFQGDNIRDDAGVALWASQPRGNELFWELEVPNGVYEVSLGLGDKSTGNIDSRHTATVEGFSIMPAFVPQDQETRMATMIVEVTDGLLTVNGLGGYNSKITHIDVTESTGTPVNASLLFDQATVSKSQVAGTTDTFSSTLLGEGAGTIGLTIKDNVNQIDRNATGNNDWLSLPTGDLGELVFNANAIDLIDGDTRDSKIIATAKGFKPAILEAHLNVVDALSAANDITGFVLDEQTQPAVIDPTTYTADVEVENGTDLTALMPEISISENATISPDSGVTTDFTSPVSYTVTAENGTTQIWTLTVNEATAPVAQSCSPLSTLPCEDVVVNLPVAFDFSSALANTITDNTGQGTGFTAILEHSEARRSGDLPVSNPNVNGYEPSLINLNGGALELLSQAGINYLNPPASSNNNNQVNTLGIGLQNITTPLTIETNLLNINTGAGSAQAGIWFGVEEDNFIKLSVIADNVELRKEVGGESINGDDSPDQILVENVGVAGQNVKLRMVVDPLVNTITAYYAINDGVFTQLTKSGLSEMSFPSAYLAGRNLNSEVTAVSFAGIYATHRNGSQFTARFDSFSAKGEKEDMSLAFDAESLSFEGNVGDEIASQNVTISATSGNPVFTLSDDPNSGDWLILPTDPALGILEFGIKSGLPANTYSTTVFAIDPNGDYATAELQISLEVSVEEPGSDQNDIASFELENATGPAVLNLEGHLVNIEVEKGTDLSALAPVITISENATISPASGIAQDFTTPAISCRLPVP